MQEAQPSFRASKRRLTKKPPTPTTLNHNMSTTSGSLKSQKSGLLRRNPSAPTYPQSSPNLDSRDHQRQSFFNSSSSSVERDTPQNAPSTSTAQSQAVTYDYPQRYSARHSLTSKSSDDMIGVRSEGVAALSTIDSTKASGYQNSLRRPAPPPLSYTSPDSRMLSPALRSSASFSIGDHREGDNSATHRAVAGSNTKRYSAETTGNRNSAWKSKNKFSTFMNNVLGSPRSVKISAPENPVHVTHVGFDNETGQFTVCVSNIYYVTFLVSVFCVVSVANFIHIYSSFPNRMALVRS